MDFFARPSILPGRFFLPDPFGEAAYAMPSVSKRDGF
jgi:hypothetical protein